MSDSTGWTILAVLFVFAVGLSALSAANARQAATQEKEFRRFAAEHGWGEVDPDQVPEFLVGPARSTRGARRRPPRLVLRAPEEFGEVWMVWHVWSTYRSRGKSRRYDETKFLLPVRAAAVSLDLSVSRRSALGARLMPVNGAGTGDAEFDRFFSVYSTDDAAATALIGPALRDALVKGEMPPFELSGRVAVIALNRQPDVEMLDRYGRAVATLGGLLDEGGHGASQ